MAMVSRISTALVSFDKASAIPRFCTNLADRLNVFPYYKHVKSETGILKTVTVERNQAEVYGIFNRNACNIVGRERGWYTQELQKTSQESTLWLSGENNRCSLQDLQEAYTQTLRSMASGWMAIEGTHPITTNCNPNDDVLLFYKKSTIEDEEKLIQLLSRQFSLDSSISCEVQWESTRSEVGVEKVLYLQIKESDWERVVDKMGFPLTSF